MVTGRWYQRALKEDGKSILLLILQDLYRSWTLNRLLRDGSTGAIEGEMQLCTPNF